MNPRLRSLGVKTPRSSTLVQDSEDESSDLSVLSDMTTETNDGERSRSQERISSSLQVQQSSPSPFIENSGLNHQNYERIQCVCGATEIKESDDSNLIRCGGCKVWQHISCVSYLCDDCSPPIVMEIHGKEIGSQTDIPATNDSHQLETKLTGAILDIQNFREKLLRKDKELEECKKDAEEYRREISLLKLARKTVEETLEGPFKQIQDLTAALRDRNTLGTFTSISSAARDRLADIKVDVGFQDIFGLSKQIFCRYNYSQSACAPEINNDLHLLVKKVLGPDFSNAQFSKFNLQSILRTLTTAALMEWVFETDFPTFDYQPSPTLAKYREILGHQGKSFGIRLSGVG